MTVEEFVLQAARAVVAVEVIFFAVLARHIWRHKGLS